MAGTLQGGKAAAATNIKKYGKDFYHIIGAKGGSASGRGGFGANYRCDGMCDLDSILGMEHKKSQCAGYKGGLISRRTKKVA